MRKQRRQPAFATLTDDEIEQIAQWLDRETYAAVRTRVNQRRAEGGFGLNILSNRPFERLWARTKTVEKINTHITKGEKLTLATFDAITEGDVPESEEIHDAILFETMESVRSGGNTPHQLLALQRLADFPARADYRDHKIEMDHFRKHIATERLELQKRRQQLAEQKLASAEAKSNPAAPKPQEDKLGPLAHDWEGVRARVRKFFNISEEESARRAALRRAWEQRQSNELNPNEPSPQYPPPSMDDTAPAAVNSNDHPDPSAPSVSSALSVVPPFPSAPLSVPCGENPFNPLPGRPAV